MPGFAEDHHEPMGPGRQRLIHKALCKGAAHEADGWIDIDEIAQQYKDLPSNSFQREFLGHADLRLGAVYNSQDIDVAAIHNVMLCKDRDVELHRQRLRALEKVIGLDWGYSGEAWAAYLVRVRQRLIVYRWEWWKQTRFSEIREHLIERMFEERIATIRPDAANPSDNDELQNLLDERSERLWQKTGEAFDCVVDPVKFSTHKSFGIGEVRRRFEKRLILLPNNFGNEPVLNAERAIKLLKAYEYDQNGIPKKKDDHCADALLCAVVHWSSGRAPREG